MAEDAAVGATVNKTRAPKCARCRNHGYTVDLRGHKGFCPHKTCTCELCALVKERQEVSRRQIKLRRQQRQEETMGMHVPVPSNVFAHGSVYGINLDYLRVVFPRKRVDRLYAVLLQNNNDVNAAAAKLHQEEKMTRNGGDLRCVVPISSNSSSSSSGTGRTLTKATQCSPTAAPFSPPELSPSPHSGYPVAKAGDDDAFISTSTSSSFVLSLPSSNPSLSSSLSYSSSSSSASLPPCMFPYCWLPALPAHFSPGDDGGPGPHNLFLARPLSTFSQPVPAPPSAPTFQVPLINSTPCSPIFTTPHACSVAPTLHALPLTPPFLQAPEISDALPVSTLPGAFATSLNSTAFRIDGAESDACGSVGEKKSQLDVELQISTPASAWSRAQPACSASPGQGSEIPILSTVPDQRDVSMSTPRSDVPTSMLAYIPASTPASSSSASPPFGMNTSLSMLPHTVRPLSTHSIHSLMSSWAPGPLPPLACLAPPLPSFLHSFPPPVLSNKGGLTPDVPSINLSTAFSQACDGSQADDAEPLDNMEVLDKIDLALNAAIANVGDDHENLNEQVKVDIVSIDVLSDKYREPRVDFFPPPTL